MGYTIDCKVSIGRKRVIFTQLRQEYPRKYILREKWQPFSKTLDSRRKKVQRIIYSIQEGNLVSLTFQKKRVNRDDEGSFN